MRYFTSDQHYYHTNVIGYCSRPFGSIGEMNERLISNYNDIIKPEDEVFMLGDFSMAFRSVELFTKRLMGQKRLIAGNHDFCHPAHKKSRNIENREKWIGKYIECGFESVKTVDEISIGSYQIRLCHLPYKDDIGDHGQNHSKHRLHDDGTILLCGHVHEKWKWKFTSNGTLMINVGVDVWNYAPVSEVDLLKLIDEVSGGK